MGYALREVIRMTLLQIERRVQILERRVARLVQSSPRVSRGWYRTHAGRFANDPVFDEIIRLGRTYRKSQRLLRQPRQS